MRARRTAITLAAALMGIGLAPLAHSAPTPTSTVRLANTVVPGLSAATRLGAVPADQQLQVVVALARPYEQAEAQLAAAVYTPGNPAYHRFLTPGQYAARFGVDAATYQRTVSWLTRVGMTVGYSSPDRTHISLDGTASEAERTFDVALSTYRVGSVEFRAHPKPALAPSNVVAIQGLQTASSYRLPSSATAAPAAQGGPCIQHVCMGELTPKNLWHVYGMDDAALNRGAGVRAAVIGEGNTTTTIVGLRRFELVNNLPQVPTRSVFVANNRQDDSGAGEWQIDSQAITGMAPDLEELSFYMSQDLPSIANAISGWVNDPLGPSIANMSIGGCETLNLALGSPLVEGPLIRQGALEGRTLFVSTGDTGGSCAVFPPLVPVNGVLNTGVPSPQWPSTSQFAVGVGGTVLYTDETTGDRDSEITWTHGGGGTSTFVPAPAWQRGVPLIKAPCSTDDALNPVTSYTPCRGVPDVSALSGDIISNGYTTYTPTGTFSGGGTSLSAPLWAGMWVRVQSAASVPLGLATPLLYGKALGTGLDSFEDVYIGSNVQWQAQPRTPANPTGWDFTNGFGTPYVDKLATAIAGQLGAVRSNTAPAQLDTVVVMDAPGSGGGGGGNTGACVATGQYKDDSGDALDFGTGAMGDVDLTSGSIQHVGGALVFTAEVVDLAATPAAKEWDFDFSVGAKNFELEAIQGAADYSDTSVLYNHDDFTSYGIQDVTVAYDTDANTITVTMPIAAFEGATSVSLAPGTHLTKVNFNGDYILGPGATPLDLPIIFDSMDGSGCADVVV